MAGGMLWHSASPAHAADSVGVVSDGFEDGTTQSWGTRSSTEQVANSTTVAHSGTHSLAVTGRTASWQGPSLDVLSTLKPGTGYLVDLWVRWASGAGTSQMRLSVERRRNGTPTYQNIVGNTDVSDSGWTELRGYFTPEYDDVDFLSIYVESASGTFGFFIDDLSISYIPTLPVQTTIPSLKYVYASDWLVGAAVAPAETLGDHGTLLAKHFNSVTTGNDMKWDTTEPTEGTFDFAEADRTVAWAQANNIKVYGHTLVWHQQVPSWVFLDASGAAMTATAANKALLLQRLTTHIQTEMTHFKGKVYAWDVVNEVIDASQSDGLRRSTWYTIAGLDYIRTAFTVAHATDPDAKLCINDYSTTDAAKRTALYNLVSQLKGEGIPIDCVGHQMHSNIDWPSSTDMDATLTAFEGLGVTQRITEMDVSVYNGSESAPYTTVPDAVLTKQSARYATLFTTFLKHAASIDSVTFWGLADDTTWLKSYPTARLDLPLLFDEQLQAKSAFWALVGSPSASTSSSGSASSASTSSSGSSSASVSATSATPVSCQVTYTIASQWSGNFQVELSIKNTGASTIAGGWSLAWTFANGQVIKSLWNGTYTQSGATVTVANTTWNADIAAGASAGIGFMGTWDNTTNAVPTAFTLNGSACTIS